MKIGRTGGDPNQRMDESLGYAPEQAILGFLLRTDDSASWEKLLHSVLTISRQEQHRSNRYGMVLHLPGRVAGFGAGPDVLAGGIAMTQKAPGKAFRAGISLLDLLEVFPRRAGSA